MKLVSNNIKYVLVVASQIPNPLCIYISIAEFAGDYRNSLLIARLKTSAKLQVICFIPDSLL